jgi:hypothetical protein
MLQEYHTSNIDQGKNSRQGAIDKGTIDEEDNIPQAVTQNEKAIASGRMSTARR